MASSNDRKGGPAPAKQEQGATSGRQSQHSGAMGRPSASGASTASSVGSSGNHGSGAQQGEGDDGGRDQDAKAAGAGRQGRDGGR